MPVAEPINYYEEVKKPPEVKMTPNLAYAVPWTTIIAIYKIITVVIIIINGSSHFTVL